MSEQTMRLWTSEGFQDDGWRHAGPDDDRSGEGRVILPLPDFLAVEEEKRVEADGRFGVLLQPGDAVEAIAPYLGSLALVALAFPAYTDGRSYSKAAILRTKHGFTGKIRACGDVLIDQIPLMLRTGFDEFEVSNATALRRLGEGRSTGLPMHYQPSSDISEVSDKYAWRRVPA